jgi:manganese-dependent inorganic pyrophosphatase
LVDHNEASQSIEDRHLHKVERLIDHHKIADFETGTPLMMRVEPVGCTCTILHEMFVAEDYVPSQTMARLMTSAILSDTLHFRSSTTTDRDRKAVEALAPLAGIDDIDSYAMQMFDAKSDLTGVDPQDIVTMDYKIFEIGGKRA